MQHRDYYNTCTEGVPGTSRVHVLGSLVPRPSPSFFVTLQYGKALYRTASDKKLGMGLGFE